MFNLHSFSRFVIPFFAASLLCASAFETKNDRDSDLFRVSFSLAFTFKFCCFFLWTFQYSIVWTKRCCSQTKCKRMLTLQNIYVLNCVQNWCANFVQWRRTAAPSPICFKTSNVCVLRVMWSASMTWKACYAWLFFKFFFSGNFFSYCHVVRFSSFRIFCSACCL